MSPLVMRPDTIIKALSRSYLDEGPLPKRALLAASRQRDEMLPLFLHEIEKFLPLCKDLFKPTPVLLIFFLLGEYGDPAAYRPLARLISRPEFTDRPGFEEAFDVIGHRVLAAVYDGDPTPLYKVILDPNAHRICRANLMTQTLLGLVVNRKLDRETVANFLIDAVDKIDSPSVWQAWATLAAHLNLPAMRPLIKQAIEHGCFYEDFKLEQFDDSLGEPSDEDFSLFRDACSELEAYLEG